MLSVNGDDEHSRGLGSDIGDNKDTGRESTTEAVKAEKPSPSDRIVELKGDTQKFVDGLGAWGLKAWKNAKASVKAGADSGRERIEQHLAGRTGLVVADSVDRLQASDNPLIRIQTQKVPQNFCASFLYAAAAAGMFQNADEVTRVTRALMDDDKSLLQQWLRKVFNPEQAADISAWMDRVPGSEVAGGFGHRLLHGHDTQAMFELMRDHGSVGGIEWANHVWLRDFWTPHGVPYLPAGSETAREWLLDMGVSPSTVLSLLSINVAEAASGLLAFYSVRRAKRGIEAFVTARRYKKSVDEIKRHVQDGSELDALRLVEDVEAFSEREAAPHLRLDLAVLCLGLSQRPDHPQAPAWGTRSFFIASNLCRASDKFPTDVPYHGDTRVSFHGLAATILASSYASQIRRVDTDWELISGRLEFGIRQFLHVANEQGNASKVQIHGKPVWGYRPYSALTNQLLALELTVAYGSLCGTSIDPVTIRRKMAAGLSELCCQSDHSANLARDIKRNLDRVYPHSEAA